MSFSLSEYTKIDVDWDFAPDPTGGAYSTPPEPLAGFKGAALWQEGNGGKGNIGLRARKEGKWVMGKGRKRGKLGE